MTKNFAASAHEIFFLFIRYILFPLRLYDANDVRQFSSFLFVWTLPRKILFRVSSIFWLDTSLTSLASLNPPFVRFHFLTFQAFFLR